MTGNQATFISLWIFILAGLVVASLVSPAAAIIVVIVAGLIVSVFQSKTVPTVSKPRTPLQVLEQSPFWKGVAVVYTIAAVVTVIYHLAVNRVGIFEDISLGLLVLLLFGPALGPIIVCQIEIYRLLGQENSS